MEKDSQKLLHGGTDFEKAYQKEVLILYAKESDNFEKVINSFEKLLQEDEMVKVRC